MSWLIGDSVSNSNAHLTSYNNEKYYSEDSWRLTKNMALIAPSNQKYQTERDIDSFLVTDEDFGFDKKYNGFAIKTSGEPKHLEVDSEDIYDTESYNEITPKTFTKVFTSYYKSYSKNEYWELLKDYNTKSKEYVYNAFASSTIFLDLQEGEIIEYTIDGLGTMQHIERSGGLFEINVEKNKKVVIKSASYNLIISSISIKIKSFYGCYNTSSNAFEKWTEWNVDKQNCGEISIWCPGYSELQSEDFRDLHTMIRISPQYRNLEKDILACVYVGGILTNSKVFSASNKASLFDVDVGRPSLKEYEDMKPQDDGLITFLVRYNDGVSPCVLMEDEIYEVMKRSQRNPSEYHYGSITETTTVFHTADGYQQGLSNSSWMSIDTLNGPDFSSDRAGYEMSTKQISVLMKPRFNSIPFSNCSLVKTGRTPPNSSYLYIAPNVKHYKSGFFTVTKAGTITLKASLRTLEFYTSYDTFDKNAQHLTVYVNGNSVYSKSSSASSVSISEVINVNEGDLIAVSFTGVMFDDTYYQLDYDYDICEKNYLIGPESNRIYQRVVSKTSYNSSHSDGSDYVFIADSDGTLTSSDMYLFVNGESVSSGAAVKKGDLVLVRINQKSNSYELDNSGSSYDNGYGHWEKKYFLRFETSKEWVWDRLENFKFSFSGSGKLYGYTYDESWEHYVSCVIVEAARWISENNLGEGAPLPLAIIDDGNDQEKVDKTFKVLDDASIYVDLWLCVKNIDKLYESDNLISKTVGFALNAPITIKESTFENTFFIKEVRIKDAIGGVNAFRHTIEEIPAQVNKLELVSISGDWTEAFKGSVTSSVNIGKFTTKELTSAYCMFSKCDIISLDENIIKTFFNDTYDKWYKGYISFRSAFVGCKNSGTVPEAYMTVEDQYDCNWDPATLIQNVVSKYDVNILPLGCYFYGLPNYTDAARLYTSNSSAVHTIKVEARHYDETKDQAAKIYIDGSLLKTNGGRRGHFICVIDCKTKSIKFEKQVDTYGEPTSADSVWSEAVGLAGENDIIIATSCDATSLTQAARDIINSAGGISSIGTWTQSRTAHAFIGKKGIGANKGFEATKSGSEYSVIEASFDEDRGLVHQDWAASQTFGLSPVYEKVDEYPLIKVEEAEFWKWGPVFSQIKDCYDHAGFIHTLNSKANFDIEVLTSGDEKQVNPNYETSFKGALSKSTFDNLILHLSNVEGVNGTNINIESMFKDINELHCVKRVTNVYDVTSAFENSKFTSLDINLDNVGIADYAFKNCDSLKTVKVVSNSCFSAMHMFEDCDVLEDFDLTGMTSLIDGTSMFENCVGLKTDFTKPSKLPDNLQIARRMFVGCNVKEISGNWIPPNVYTSYRNQEENGIGNLVDEFPGEVVLSKEGWSFPEQLSDAYMMFKGNPIIKVSNLSFNSNANNSWIFQDCENLIILKDSFLNIDTFNDAKHTGMFDGCSLKKENVLWLPISINSKFDLKHTGITSGSNEKPLQYLVDDHWCEVDNSGFVEYQHIRRPAYLQVYKDNDYDDILIKFWSHPHIHSAEMRGFNELHDTKVYYDPESLHGGLIDYNKWLKKN